MLSTAQIQLWALNVVPTQAESLEAVEVSLREDSEVKWGKG